MAYKKRSSPSDKSAQTRSREAAVCLKNKKYRQAIDIYKALLKSEPKPKWQKGLAEAYRGRIEELVQKNMYKEARMILDNMVANCQVKVSAELQALLALASQDFENAVSVLKAPTQLGPEFLERFGNLIASRMLTASESEFKKVASVLDLSPHRQTILTALQALADGDDDNCNNLLSTISYRSIYKDFRLFIKALASYYRKDSPTALTCFDKIPVTSTLKKLAQTAEALINNKLFVENSPKSGLPDAQELTFALALAGKKMSESTFSGIYKEAFIEFKKSNWFKLIRANQNAFDPVLLKKLCYQALYLDSSSFQEYNLMWDMLPPFEIIRLQALNLERLELWKMANNYWISCFDMIDHSPFETEAEKNLARAILLRKIAHNKLLSEHLKASDEWDDEDDWDDDVWDEDEWDENEINDFAGNTKLARSSWQSDYEKSLEYDPADRASFDKLLNYYNHSGNKRMYRHWLELYLKQFPTDITRMLSALEEAFERKAYNIAIGHADRILQLDPMNRNAKELKIYILVTKARKHIEKRKFYLAREEFQRAAAVFDEAEGDGTVYIKWGFCEYLAANHSEGDRLAQKGLEMLGEGLKAALVAFFESKRMRLPDRLVKKYQAYFQTRINEPATVPDVLDLIDTIGQYRGIQFAGKVTDLNLTLNYLKKAVTCDYDLTSLKKICDYFYSSRDFPMLKNYAAAGLKKFPNNPAIIFLFMIGKCANMAMALNHQDLKKLKNAELLAQKTGDHKTARDIRNFIALPANPFLPQDHRNMPEIEKEINDFLNNINPDLLSEIIEDILELNRREKQSRARKANPRGGKKENPKKPGKEVDPDQLPLF